MCQRQPLTGQPGADGAGRSTGGGLFDRRGAVEPEKLPPAQARGFGPQPGVPGPCSELCGAGRGLTGPAENFSWVKLHPVEPGRRHDRAHPRMNRVDPN